MSQAPVEIYGDLHFYQIEKLKVYPIKMSHLSCVYRFMFVPFTPTEMGSRLAPNATVKDDDNTRCELTLRETLKTS